MRLKPVRLPDANARSAGVAEKARHSN
jgi:hypothetical protein